MSKKAVDARDITQSASELFRLQGYHKTSISDIAEGCGLSKASIYHHISSKKELATKAILTIHQEFTDSIFSIAYDSKLSTERRVNQFFKAIENFFNTHPGGCLVANLVLEINEVESEFRQLFQNYFTDWQNAVAHILESCHPKDKAIELAKRSVAITQGAVMMMHVYQSKQFLSLIEEDLSSAITNKVAVGLYQR